MTVEPDSRSASGSDVPPQLQRRNLLCYAFIRMLLYTAAPVTYVTMHSVLVNKFGGSNFAANLPTTAMMWMTAIPLLVTWLLPQLRVAKAVVVTAFAMEAVIGGVVALALFLPVSTEIRIGLLILHGTLVGAGSVLGDVYSWEILKNGMSEKSRGRTLAMAFSIGPLFAALSALGQKEILGGKVSWLTQPGQYYDFAFLFALSLPIMGTAAFLATRYYVPKSEANEVLVREPLPRFIFGGLRSVLVQRQFFLLILAYLIGSVVWACYDNSQLNIKLAIGKEPQELTSVATFLRFSGKMVAGMILGLIASRMGARASAATTMLFTTIGVFWVLSLEGMAYMGAFAFYGAGELSGVYFPNYCVSASKPAEVKRNLSLFYLTGLIPVAAINGLIADKWDYRASFMVGLAAGVLAIIITLLLPYRKPVAKDVPERAQAMEA